MGKDVALPMTLSFNVKNNVIKEIVKFDGDTRWTIADHISNISVMNLS